jgi:hypothetical protein
MFEVAADGLLTWSLPINCFFLFGGPPDLMDLEYDAQRPFSKVAIRALSEFRISY